MQKVILIAFANRFAPKGILSSERGENIFTNLVTDSKPIIF